MVEAGMIVYADHTGIVSTIFKVVIDWEEEFAALNTGEDKIDPLLEDMPPLEDASDDERIVVSTPTADEGIVIEIPQPYEYSNNKAVHWSYGLNVDLNTRSGLEQLCKMPVQISLLELLQTSVKHQKTLMKMLSEVHVPETIDHDKLEECVGSILLKDLIAFSDEEFPLKGRGHTKALYISVKYKASHVARVLIDNGSSLNICPLATLHRLKIYPSRINSAKTSVRAFDGTKKEVMGEIHLDIQIGPIMFNILFQGSALPVPEMSNAAVMVGRVMVSHDFNPSEGLDRNGQGPARIMYEKKEVIDTLGQPSGNFDYYVKYSTPLSFYIDPRDIVSNGWGGMDNPTPLVMEDPDDAMEGITAMFDDMFIGVIEEGPLKGMGTDPQEGNLVIREGMGSVQFDELCAIKPDPDDTDELDNSSDIQRDLEHHERPKVLTSDQTITLNLSDSGEPKEVKIGATLPEDPSIVEHSLPTNPGIPPKKQRLRRTKPELSKKIEEEVMKFLKVGFIEVTRYLSWVANIVPVMKKDGQVWVCIDYHDLNKANLKDDFPLPYIDVMIKMKDDDKEKTAFIIPWGTFHYKVMPFGLKNARTTYQRAMVTLFHDTMHKKIEVYVDDMIAKSRPRKSHVDTLKKLFERFREFKLRLNPAKCIFGATPGKLLWFIVSSKGNEVDPSKVKAICELQPPLTVKEVQSLLGRLNYIARFISQLFETAKLFFKLLKKNAQVEWNDDCREAFNELKRYLMKPPVLVPPILGQPLILYLMIHSESVGAMLA
ncbi:uncharacterized protein LOC130138977 [Syzygium oleosum]|uniref:uncharacterized protein LOC130138977 n=1 Tax=Syzygium oleosum TaxID=219896 RepID=UPI0024B94F76|nr:uncharacterized protein LOC130138977 [Syzygium oleosum]